MLSDRIYYTSDQIKIPPQFPEILKEYCKCAIQEQPHDLLEWSVKYFKGLLEEQEKQSKFERAVSSIYGPSYKGLSLPTLQWIYRQFDSEEKVTLSELEKVWIDLRLSLAHFRHILDLASIDVPMDDIEWRKVLILATASISLNLRSTVLKFFVVASSVERPEMPFKVFQRQYQFLAELTGIPKVEIDQVIGFAQDAADSQNGIVNRSDLEKLSF